MALQLWKKNNYQEMRKRLDQMKSFKNKWKNIILLNKENK